MNKSNIQNKKQTKNVTVYATISVMVAFALVASPLLLTENDAYAFNYGDVCINTISNPIESFHSIYQPYINFAGLKSNNNNDNAEKMTYHSTFSIPKTDDKNNKFTFGSNSIGGGGYCFEHHFQNSWECDQVNGEITDVRMDKAGNEVATCCVK
ncbi:MAG: hypothetical protein R2685_15585 [Candidatus Nitrosocosmicus sp.]|nr:hypothetical protein [Candidatus Nitrosocosmicus sp.]